MASKQELFDQIEANFNTLAENNEGSTNQEIDYRLQKGFS